MSLFSLHSPFYIYIKKRYDPKKTKKNKHKSRSGKDFSNHLSHASSLIEADLRWRVRGMRTRWLSEGNEHLWECILFLMWVLIVIDGVTTDHTRVKTPHSSLTFREIKEIKHKAYFRVYVS